MEAEVLDPLDGDSDEAARITVPLLWMGGAVCKLDPGLKAPPDFPKFDSHYILKRIAVLFQLDPLCF